jgi:predicted ribosome quality control (RQC) complex YloA/Tae2 family protein
MALQPMDVTSLKAVLAEWRPVLLPSRFEKAQQSDTHTLQLGLRHLGGLQWLELSWQAEAARCHAIPPPPRHGDGSTLAQQLQHGLRGLALVELEQPGWERLLRLGFARRPGEPIERQLVLEMMGRHSNLFLLEAANDASGGGTVIALGRQVKGNQSRLRPIGTGDPYQLPPPLGGEPPSLAEPPALWRQRLLLLPLPLERALRDAYQGISPALARQLAPAAWLEQPVNTLTDEQWHHLWGQWQAWLGAIDAGHFSWQDVDGGYRCWQPPHPAAPLPQPESPHTTVPNGPASPAAAASLPLNGAVMAYYRQGLAQRHLGQRRQQLEHRLSLAAERERRQAAEQQRLLSRVPESEQLQLQADALLSQRQPSRDCIDQAQALYRQARKLRRSVAAITPRLEEHQRRLGALEASLTYLEQFDPDEPGSQEAIEALAAEVDDQLGRPGANRRDRRQAARSAQTTAGEPRPLEVRSPGGLPLQVGRNHRQNEWITFRQARRGDLWFHAQELPGSHVVLKSSEASASDADLQAAADLAAHFSRGRANRRVPVVMVPTTDLQRIPGSAPGTVRHRGGEVLWGEPERALTLLAPRPEEVR